MELKISIDVARGAEDVFEYLKDVKNNVEWEKEVVEMEYTSEGPVGVGSTGRRVEKYMGTDESTFEITEYKENKHVAVAFGSDKFEGDLRWDLESSGEGTRVAFQMRGRPKGLVFKLMMPLFSPMVKRQVRRNFGTLKGILESQS